MSVQAMKKRIAIADLQIGMFVSELDRPWLETPFLFQGIEVRCQKDIDELRQYCKFVYIDTQWVEQLDSPTLRSVRKVPIDPEINEIEQKKIEFEILKKSVEPHQRTVYEDKTTLEEEIEKIGETRQFAQNLISEIMEDVRLGKALRPDLAKQTVHQISESVIRNPDALICYNQLKHVHQYTAEHSMRVCVLALVFGRHLGFEEEQLQTLGLGALLHDMGKMKIPLDVLNKPGELTQEEALLMEEHVPLGVEILENTTDIPPLSIEVARCHHERFDGSGYKSGLKGDNIGLFGLIGGIVDFYDAVTSDRVYRKGLPPHVMLREMYKLRQRSFDAHLVEQFIQCIGVYPIGSIVELNTGDIGVVTTMNRQRRLKPRVSLVYQADQQPYPERRIINLVTDRAPNGGIYEISTVLEPEHYSINPADHLPIAGVA